MSRPDLSKQQRTAILTRSTLSFVESAPGSGKTTVAAERFGVLHHTRNDDTDSRGIVAVSFARSAVSELRTRIVTRWGSRTVQRPNRVTTMDGLHRCLVQFLLLRGLIVWPGGVTQPTLIDSWARQRGATRVRPGTGQNQRWELCLNGTTLAPTYRAVESACWGMLFAKKDDWIASLSEGVCTHDEIRQIVGLALGKIDLRDAIDAYLQRSFKHVIVDEAFDLNGLDALLVRRAIESGVGVTLVGDPWQALYEWRGARPDMVHEILADYNFDDFPIPRSYRFKTDETIELARSLRAREPVVVPQAKTRPDVVIAAEWDHLPTSGPDVIPLSFGQLDCQADASLSLLLDQVTRARLGIESLGQAEAMRCLRREQETLDLQSSLTILRNPAIALEEVMDHLRSATKVSGRRKPSLPAKRVPSRLLRLALLRGWIITEQSYVPGLTFHQAKGREWGTVDVALAAAAQRALAKGLDPTNELHRKIYVGLTRGIRATRLRAI